MRLISRLPSLLCSQGPASSSASSSSDCSLEDPLVAPLPWISPLVGLLADIGLPTGTSKFFYFIYI